MSKAGQLLYYFDLLSQPSRVLKILLDVNKVPYTPKLINLAKGQHLQEEFTSINKFKRVPVIKHNDFVLTESVAIARYLCRETNIADHWYPKDSQKQAKVDEFLEWQHIDLRYTCMMFFQTKFLRPLLTGRPANEEKIEFYKKIMTKSLDQLENKWLTDAPFICGDTITLADLFGACEIEQPRMAGYEPGEGRPKVNAWKTRVENELKPYYTETHKYVNKIVGQQKSKL